MQPHVQLQAVQTERALTLGKCWRGVSVRQGEQAGLGISTGIAAPGCVSRASAELDLPYRLRAQLC